MKILARLAPTSAPPLALALVAAGLTPPAAAQLVRNTADLPTGLANVGNTEALALGDVDLDGDFDVVLAQLGFSPGGQNQLWINQGGLQGGTKGHFVDDTAARLPALLDPSRGVQLADLDRDGDLDLFVSNLSPAMASRFWINQGGAQGGTLGYFVDETAARWLGIGGPGSSLAPSELLGPGEFRDYSADSACADLDGDGDLDLVHSAGSDVVDFVPTRVFLNDGTGRFQEFNPAGHTPTGPVLEPGAPGLWCDGLQREDTLDTTGVECDITLACADVDVADLDGDFDLDIVLGHVFGLPRVFANRLEASALAPAQGGAPGALGFRDVTARVFPTVHATGGVHYAQELGDLDGDGDLDLYGANWFTHEPTSDYRDVTFVNQGDGTFGPGAPVAGSQDDDDDVALFDYDNDGDLDAYGANYLKTTTFDTLFRNDSPGAGTVQLTDRSQDLEDVSNNSAGVAACDVDGDGDYDVLVATGFGGPQIYFENHFDVPDTTAPSVPRLEAAPHRTAGPAPTVVRAHVLDNAPSAVSAFHATTLRFRVDGGAVTDTPMTCSGAQVHRGELPGTLVGSVTYWVESADLYGNLGVSAARSFVAAPSGQLGPNYCTANPNSTGQPAHISATGSNEVALNDVTLSVTNLPASSFGYFLTSLERGSIPNPAGSQGNLCLWGLIGRFVGHGQIQNTGAASAVQLAIDLQAHPTPSGLIAVAPGDVWHFTYWYRDANPGTATNFSDGITLAFR